MHIMHKDTSLMLRFKPGYYLDARSTGREEPNPYESLAQRQRPVHLSQLHVLSQLCQHTFLDTPLHI